MQRFAFIHSLFLSYLDLLFLIKLMQICRVEDVNVEGLIEGSVVHFHWVRSVNVESSGAISATGLGILYLLF